MHSHAFTASDYQVRNDRASRWRFRSAAAEKQPTEFREWE